MTTYVIRTDGMLVQYPEITSSRVLGEVEFVEPTYTPARGWLKIVYRRRPWVPAKIIRCRRGDLRDMRKNGGTE